MSKRLSLKILLVFSLLAPLQLGSFAYAESSDVLTKGQLVRPGGGGYPRVTFCPPNMAAAGITMQTNILSSGLLLDLRIECIDQGKRPLTDGWDGLRVVKVLEAAEQSLLQNGAPVSLPTVSGV